MGTVIVSMASILPGMPPQVYVAPWSYDRERGERARDVLELGLRVVESGEED